MELVLVAVVIVAGFTVTACVLANFFWKYAQAKDRQLDAFADRVQAPAAAIAAAHRRQIPLAKRPEPDEDDFPVLPSTDHDLVISELMEP